MVVTYAEKLAKSITKARTDAGITRAELSRLTGISPKSLKRYEDGLQVPHKSTLRIIEKALKVSMNELMTGKAEVKPKEPVDPFALKPCPFCGGEAMLIVHSGVHVACRGCRARSPSFSDDETITLGTNAVKSVIEAWNRRTNEQEN